MIGGLRHARHDVLVISDSDVRLKPDYLKTIVAPLSDPESRLCVHAFTRPRDAATWFEKMELLTLNADYDQCAVRPRQRRSKFCLGASAALRRSTLEQVGRTRSLAPRIYLVEDYEMGRRIWMLGKRVALIPYSSIRS